MNAAHRSRILFFILLCLFCIFVIAEPATASLEITFSNGDAFDGTNLTAGNNTVDLSGYSPGLVLTNQNLNTSARLNSVNFGLGINTLDDSTEPAGQIDDDVDQAEFWSFSLNQAILFEGIGMNLGAMGQKMHLSSPAWNSLSILPGNSEVTFGAGTFTLTNLGPNPDLYTLAELSGGSPLLVPAGTWITIAAGDNSRARLRSLRFTVVPEPTTCFVWMGLVSAAAAIYKPWKR